VISRLEDFSAKVASRLDGLDRAGMQEIIRILVRRIEIDHARIEVIFRVPPPDGPSRPSPTDETATWQHCTGVVERTFAWLGRCRRLAKDFEATIASAVAWVLVAHIRTLTRRIARA